MKRVLHIVGTMNRAGAETMIMNLYRVIDRTQIQFDFLYFTTKHCDFDNEITELGGEIYRIKKTNPISRMYATKKLLSDKKHWQIIHAHTLFSNAFHIFAAYKAGVKQRVSHSHTINTQFKNRLLKFIYPYLSRIVQRKYATDFVACSLEAGKFMFKDEKNVQILNNSIDTSFFAETARVNNNYINKEFNIEKDTLILLQLGRLSKAKNHKFTIQIASQLKRKNVKFKMFFAGEGMLLSQLNEQIKTANLMNEIVFLGLRSDVPELLASADLMLMPSLYEGFGVVLLEAQATGTPSLISNTIPSDSDVGLNLIHVKSLQESALDWANSIVEITNKTINVSSEKRLGKLRKAGYDVQKNIKTLKELYK